MRSISACPCEIDVGLQNGWVQSGMSVDLMIDRLGKLLSRPLMSGKTRPVSMRLAKSEIEQLHSRAHTLSATIGGVARDLIRTGLAGGDNRALADRLMRIERRLVALEQQGQETNARLESIDKAARDLLAMFEALLKALSGESGGRAV
jgi:hypothetical protein